MPEINPPAVVAQVASLHDAYERALVANDVPALTAFFWDSPQIVRYGVNEHLYGAETLAAYRQASAPVFTDRKLLRRTILALGADAASVMCEFSQYVMGNPRHGRQSQVWVNFGEAGWKIVAAHVSNALTAPPTAASWEVYADQASAALGLTLAPAHRAGVAQQLQRAAEIAAPLLALDLPESAEGAGIFAP